MKLLQKDFTIEILKNFIDLMLTSTLSELCIKNIAPLLKDILNYSEISKDGKKIIKYFRENNI